MLEDFLIQEKIASPENGTVDLSEGQCRYMALGFTERLKVRVEAEEAKAEAVSELAKDLCFKAHLIKAACYYGVSIIDGVAEEYAHRVVDPETLESFVNIKLNEDDMNLLARSVLESSGMLSLLDTEEDDEEETEDDSGITSQY